MNSNYTSEAKKPLNRPNGKGTRYMCHNEKIRALLGIDDFEELLHSISTSSEHTGQDSGLGANPESSCEGICYIPVAITAQSLLDDLERMLEVFDHAVLSVKDWQELEKGFFDLLFVKFKLYCIQMNKLGRSSEVHATKKQLMNVLQKRINAGQAYK